MTAVLGIEGTAWNLGVAIVNQEEIIAEAESTYQPPMGGIHPREAAQHHAENVVPVTNRVLELARKRGLGPENLDAIAFSRGPGLGPALRTVATAARALALRYEKPLVGVNHCVAHVEVGKWQTGSRDPVVLYVSGANSQVIAYRAGKYRVYGETLDIGAGNMLDKFARSVGLPHPGGPRIEELAGKATDYVPLPYVVKGMDFSFSGIMSAAKEALNRHSLENVAYSLQENAFAMMVEVTERALAHTEKEEVLLVGGVGANMRLQEMLRAMCEDRGARFYAPPRKFMGDNGIMIAYTGLLMYQSGNTLRVEDSGVIPGYRPEDVDVTWMDKV